MNGQQQQGGGHLSSSLAAAQQSRSDVTSDPEERLIIIKVPREHRPFSRENVVDSLLGYGLDFEAVVKVLQGT